LDHLRDPVNRARIAARFYRLKAGLLENAHSYWKDYQGRTPKPPIQRSKPPAK
jgi:hypothetical protein